MTAIANLPGLLVNSVPANDDGFSPPVRLPFPINFYGKILNAVWCNTNGNFTFGTMNDAGQVLTGAGLATYTPYGIQTSPIPLISVYWADFDTRSPSPRLVTYGADTFLGRPCFGADWIGLGYYGRSGPHMDKQNSCQCLLVDRSDVGAAGDFDIVMNFGAIQWETGDASGGVDGLHGVSAAVGYSAGTPLVAGTFLEFPGSRVPGSFLDSSRLTGLRWNSGGAGVPGRYVFPVRSGIPAPPPLPPPSDSPFNPPPLTFPTGDLSGVVTSGGANLAGADVLLPFGQEAMSAASTGAYEIDRVPIGLYSVQVAKCGYYPARPLATIAANLLTTLNVNLTSLSPADAANGFLCGWVFDPVAGTPLPNVTVQAGSASAVTDAGGGFCLTVAPGQASVTLTDEAGFSTSAGPFTVGAGCATSAGPIGLPPPPDILSRSEIFGYVEDAMTQGPLPGAKVGLVEYPLFQAASGGDGYYDLPLVPGGQTLTVAAALTGYRTRRAQVIAPATVPIRVDLGLVPLSVAVGSMDGFVTDSVTGLAVAGATVRVPGVTQAVSDSDGYYRLADVPTGSLPVQAIADGYGAAQVVATVTDGATLRQNFALTAGAGCALYGQVRDAVTGAGIAGAALSAGTAPGPVLTGTSAARGAYLLSPIAVPPTPQTVQAQATGFYPLALAAVPVAAGANVELNLGLVNVHTPVGSLHGYVLDARHSSVRLAGAAVSIGPYLQAIASSPYGEYLVPYLPSGLAFAGTASDAGYFPLHVAGVETQTGQTLEMDWPLTGYSDAANLATLQVTVLEAGSLRPLPGMTVDSGAFGAARPVTDSNGMATLTLPFGAYTVAASGPGYRVGTGTILLNQSGATMLRMLLAGFPDGYVGGQVYGHVTAALLPPGQAVPNCLVSAVSPSMENDVLGDANGFYVLDNVPTIGSPAYALTFDQADYVPRTIGNVHALPKAAVRVDCALALWDGRLPAGWRVAYAMGQVLSRPPAFHVLTLPETPANVALRRRDTLALVSPQNTTQLARYRRFRYDCQGAAANASPYRRVALALAPGAACHFPEAMAIEAAPPKPAK